MYGAEEGREDSMTMGRRLLLLLRHNLLLLRLRRLAESLSRWLRYRLRAGSYRRGVTARDGGVGQSAGKG